MVVEQRVLAGGGRPGLRLHLVQRRTMPWLRGSATREASAMKDMVAGSANGARQERRAREARSLGRASRARVGKMVQIQFKNGISQLIDSINII